MSNNGSLEYNSLLQFRSDLINCLQHCPSVVENLLEEGLVTEDVHEWILTARGVSDRDRARRLVSCVTACIRHSADKFNIFIEVLQRYPYLSCVAGRIHAEYRCRLSLSHKSEGSTSSASGSCVASPIEAGRGKQEGMCYLKSIVDTNYNYKRQIASCILIC